ncbi:DUF6328 family protein [Microbacterium arabinogalactanolyticum]|uniref:DUF6328 family protein n=1 Tax=Microbacterium arabinogalactanolyticum TaxID=69365 RepID=UPI0025537BCF|nr:DUF6328 family protein [Microbacterium arabinogalactanolyticum]GLC85025.1 hypothetical protein MIAR_16120 [Microbacterium arabinogalactanolyticum]
MEAPQQRPGETPLERADRNWNELMQELRVMQTGTQILTGFLLAVAFQPRFADLDAVQRTLYVVLVLLAATATVLALAPVGMHRLLFHQHRKIALVRTANRLVKANLVVIGAVTVGVVALILDVTLNRPSAIVASALGVVAILLLWVGLPAMLKRGQD